MRWFAASRLRIFWFFFALAFAVRIVIAWVSGYLFQMHVTEMLSIAINVANTGDYDNAYGYITGPTAHSTPPFPLFMAALMSVFGSGAAGQVAIATVTCAASALRCALTPLFVEDAGLGRGAAILSGVLSVFYIGALQTEIRGGLDGPFVALALLAIVWMSMRLWRSGSWRTRTPWAFFAVCGFSALLNPQVIPVIAGIAAVGLWACTAEFRKRFLVQAVWLAVSIFVFLLPWGMRNWMVLDSFILTRSDLGLELWLSNGPGRTFDLPTNYGNLDPAANQDEAAKVAAMGEAAYNRERMQEAVSWIRANPSPFARLTVRRFIAWWLPPGNGAIVAANAGLTLLAFAGLWILWTSYRLVAALFAVTWLTFPNLYYVIEWSSRFRYPMDWQLVICAAVALHFGWRMWRGRRRAEKLHLASVPE